MPIDHNRQTIVGPVVTSSVATNLVNQGLSGSQAWLVNVVAGGGGAASTGSFSGVVTVANTASITGSVILGLAPTVLQGTSPWQITGSVGLTMAPTVLQGTSPWQITGSVGLTMAPTVLQGTSPWQITGSVGLTMAPTVLQGTSPWTCQGPQASGSALSSNPFTIAGVASGTSDIAPVITDADGRIIVVGNDLSGTLPSAAPFVMAGVNLSGNVSPLATDQAGRIMPGSAEFLYSNTFISGSGAQVGTNAFNTGFVDTRGCSGLLIVVNSITAHAGYVPTGMGLGYQLVDGNSIGLSTLVAPGSASIGTWAMAAGVSAAPSAPVGFTCTAVNCPIPNNVFVSGTLQNVSASQTRVDIVGCR